MRITSWVKTTHFVDTYCDQSNILYPDGKQDQHAKHKEITYFPMSNSFIIFFFNSFKFEY